MQLPAITSQTMAGRHTDGERAPSDLAGEKLTKRMAEDGFDIDSLTPAERMQLAKKMATLLFQKAGYPGAQR